MFRPYFIRRAAFMILLSSFLGITFAEAGLRLALANLPTVPESTLEAVKYYRLNDDGFLAADNVELPGYTVHNNQRLTTDQPTIYSRTVWVYGSSTVWGAYVPDGSTIPSYLQRNLNRLGLHWRVINVGRPGLMISGQYYWLKRDNLKAGDLVVFLDGIVDLKGITQDARKDWLAHTIPCQLATHTPLMVLALWCDCETQGETPGLFVEAEKRPGLAQYWRTIQDAEQWTRARNVTFYHFFQPAITPYPGLYVEMRRGETPLIVGDQDRFDDLHYSARGNEQIAAQLLKALLLSLQEPKESINE
jgi:hypothetical protein